jgi:GDP/UDP-N,N'-diacetylbacillosamine 2-epimerase (hydrolysing)
MTKKRKILYVSGTRADYGLMKRTLFLMKKHPGLRIEIAVVGMHLMPEFGQTINEVKKDGFKIHKLEATYDKDDKESMAVFLGKSVQLLVKRMKKIKPHMILVLGDRAEMLAGAIAGTYLTIPVAHIGGGDVTGTVDEFSRHAITKLSHLHFASNENSAERIKKMGEESWRIFKVGAPALDAILNEKLFSKKEIARKYNLDISRPILLLIQHPVTLESENSASQIKESLEAMKELGIETVVIFPNADAGGRKMIKIIERYKKLPFIKSYKNIPFKDYLSLMRTVSVIVGNSSSGIIEAPSFGLPAINVGTRQKRREQADNVINVDYNKKEIKRAVQKALYDKRFRAGVKKCRNPYGDGRAGMRIARILSKIKINKKLLQKQITY